MSEAAELIQRAKEIRQRLRQPPNAVKDIGIDLRRREITPKIPPTPPKENPVEVLEHLNGVVQVPVAPLAVVIQRPFVRKLRPIAKVVCKYYKTPLSHVLGPSRNAHLCKVRQIIIYFARQHTNLSTPKIGRHIRSMEYKAMDHASVIHSVRKVRHRRETDQAFSATLTEIEDLLFGRHYASNLPNSPVAAINQQDMAQQRQEGLPFAKIHDLACGGGLGDKGPKTGS